MYFLLLTGGGKLKFEPLTESYYFILLCLYKKPNHGYGIMIESANMSKGRVKIGSGTMYGATSNMLKKGWIAEKESKAEGERKRLYELTELGKQVIEQEILRLEQLLECADEIFKDR